MGTGVRIEPGIGDAGRECALVHLPKIGVVRSRQCRQDVPRPPREVPGERLQWILRGTFGEKGDEVWQSHRVVETRVQDAAKRSFGRNQSGLPLGVALVQYSEQ